MNTKKIILKIFLAGSISLAGCKKLITVGSPQNQLTTDKVFSDTVSATAAIASIYASFNVSLDPSYNTCMGLYTDELTYQLGTQDFIDFYQDKVTANNITNLNIWTSLYLSVYQCNDIIAQLNKSTALSPATANALSNEARFLRAYAYFYLVTSYGKVPLLLNTDVTANSHATQSDSAAVFQQIIEDLTTAKNGLPDGYTGAGRVRANKFAASAMLARVYLYLKDFTDAENEASTVINSGLYTPLNELGAVFIANSQETILSFWTPYGYITNADNLVPSGDAPQFPVSSSLLNAFDSGDLRKSAWIGTVLVGADTFYFPYKYHNRDENNDSPEYLVALRAAEQYLIRAESEANGAGAGVTGAIADLNVVRSRAGLPNYAGAVTTNAILASIYKERQLELFVENGNRFLDLKRTGLINPVMSTNKSTWVSSAVLLPVPQNEITFDHNLKQNTGY